MSDSETMIGPSRPGGQADFKVFPKHYAELLVILRGVSCWAGCFYTRRQTTCPVASLVRSQPNGVFTPASRAFSLPLAPPDIAWHSLRMLTEGVWSEIRVGGECLRLFSEDCAQGVLASVYNVNGKTWIAPSEPVENIQQGKAKAEAYAKAYLKRSVNLELPSLEWKSSRST